MKYELIIVRYGEISLKSKYTRKLFERILVKNIKNAFKKEEIDNNFKKERGRIYIYTKEIEKSLAILKKIFGIVSFSPAKKTDSSISSISKLAVDFSKIWLKKDMSFAIRVKRSGEHNYTSQDIAIKVGDEIVKNFNASVDLTNPDFELFIEIRNKDSFIFCEKIDGPSGMPLGSQDNVLCIVDDIYSILASFYILRRGCRGYFYIMNESILEKLILFQKNWYIEYNNILTKQNKNFYDEIKQVSNEKKCKAVVTNFFDLNKKNISKIKEFKKEINIPILHPLISMDEKTLKEKLKEIGLYK